MRINLGYYLGKQMQRVEVGDAIDAEHDGLAVDDEAGLADLSRRLDNPRTAVGKIVAATGHQAHALAVALKPEAVAVVLDRGYGLYPM